MIPMNKKKYLETANEHLQYIMSKTSMRPIFSAIPEITPFYSKEYCEKFKKVFRSEIDGILFTLTKSVETEGIINYRKYLQGKITFRTLSVHFAKFFVSVFGFLAKKYFDFEWVTDINTFVVSQFSGIH